MSIFSRSPKLHKLLRTSGNLDKITPLLTRDRNRRSLASIREKNNAGESFFQKAILKDRWDVIEWLLYGLQTSKSKYRYPIQDTKTEIIKLFERTPPLLNKSGKPIIVSLVEQKLLHPDVLLSSKGLTPLHIAYRTNNLRIFDELLHQYNPADIQKYDDFLGEFLHLSLSKGDFETTELLLNKNANPNFAKDNKTPLQIAFEAGNCPDKIINDLLQAGADPNITLSNHKSLLQAAYWNRPELIESLLAHRADINIQNKDETGDTLLHLVIRKSSLEDIQLCLQHGANPNIENAQGYIPLQLILLDNTSHTPWEQIVSLMHYGAALNIQLGEETLLTRALEEGQWKIFQAILDEMPKGSAEFNTGDLLYKLYEKKEFALLTQLIEKGADCNQPDSRTQHYLLHLAIQDGQLDIVDVLLKHHADITIPYPNSSDTPLSKAFFPTQTHPENPIQYNWSLIERLIAYAPRLNQWNTIGFPDKGIHPLAIAAKKGQWEIIHTLLENNEDLLGTTQWTELPNVLYTLIQRKKIDLAEQLAKKGVKLSNNTLILHTVVTQNHADTASLVQLVLQCLEDNADPNQYNEKGNTALHTAIEHNVSIDIIKALLETQPPVQHLEPNHLNKVGKSALHIAIENNASLDYIQALLECGANPNQHKEIYTDLRTTISNQVADDVNTELPLKEEAISNERIIQVENSGTALHTAIANGTSIDVINLLLDKGADPNERDEHGNTALHTAIEHNASVDIINALLNHEIQEKAHDEPSKAIETDHNKAEVVSITEQPKPEIIQAQNDSALQTETDQNGSTEPTHQPSSNHKLNDTNVTSKEAPKTTQPTPLTQTKISRKLNKAGQSALHMAIKNKASLELIQTLLEHGANPNQHERIYEELHTQADEKEKSNELLLKENLISKIEGKKGDTALHMAISEDSDDDIIKLLLDNGANPNISDTDNLFVLHVAITNQRSLGLIEALLQKGANPNQIDDDGDTPLSAAFDQAFHEEDELEDLSSYIELLIAHQADINGYDNEGNPLLHHYILRNDIDEIKRREIVAELLQYQPDLKVKNEQQKTALELAIEHKQSAIVELLIDQGINPYPDDFTLLNKIALHDLTTFSNLISKRLEVGLTLNPTNEYKITLLKSLLRAGQLSAAKVILDQEIPIWDSTHRCQDINETVENQSVTLSGRVSSYRKQGGIISFKLRDEVTQRDHYVRVICHAEQTNAFKVAKQVRNGNVIQVTGKVQSKPEDIENTNPTSSQVELITYQIRQDTSFNELVATLSLHNRPEPKRWDIVHFLLQYRDKLHMTKDNIPDGDVLLYEALDNQQWIIAAHLLNLGILLNPTYEYRHILDNAYVANLPGTDSAIDEATDSCKVEKPQSQHSSVTDDNYENNVKLLKEANLLEALHKVEENRKTAGANHAHLNVLARGRARTSSFFSTNTDTTPFTRFDSSNPSSRDSSPASSITESIDPDFLQQRKKQAEQAKQNKNKAPKAHNSEEGLGLQWSSTNHSPGTATATLEPEDKAKKFHIAPNVEKAKKTKRLLSEFQDCTKPERPKPG